MSENPSQQAWPVGRGKQRTTSAGGEAAGFTQPYVKHVVGRGRGRNSKLCNPPGVGKPGYSPQVKSTSQTSYDTKSAAYQNQPNASTLKTEVSNYKSSSGETWRPMADITVPPESPQTADLHTLRTLERLWLRRQNKEAIQEMKDTFARSENPYQTALTLIGGCSDLTAMKTISLACNLAREFKLWVSSNASSLASLLDLELQMKAFHLATLNERTVFPQFFECLADAFQLESVSYIGLPFCKKLIDWNKQKVSLLPSD